MKKIFLISLIVATSFPCLAQMVMEEDKPSWMDRIYVGGGLGANGGNDGYGNRYFYVGLYPIIGYRVTQDFSVGTALSWQHYDYPDLDKSINQYGFAPFVRYNFGQIFLYSEYMLMKTDTYYTTYRSVYDRLLMGIGYSQPVGRGSLNAMALYDMIYNQADGAFASPWVFRVFVAF